jgi:adenosylcobinamide-phosphate synthase
MSAALLPPAVWGLAVLVALVIDHRWGEPPVRWHPVVWMGTALGWAGRRIAPIALVDPVAPVTPVAHGEPTGGWAGACAGWWAEKIKPFGLGALAWCALAALVVAVAWGLQSVLMAGHQAAMTALSGGVWRWAPGGVGQAMGQTLAGVLAALVLGALLKPLLALRMLCDEVRAVEAALGQSLAAGRERLSWLVSRDVVQLTEAEVRESAIETLAENFNDSVVAPLFWFALAGLPGAVLYRLANTADAMWGYRGERGGRDWTWAGKWAARADDVLSWLPARLTALLLVVAAGGAHWHALRRCLRHLRHLPMEARRSPSPNSGWPMAAMALALDIRLGKPGAYVLNARGRVPRSEDFLMGLNVIKNMALSLYFIALTAIVLDVFCNCF